MAKDMPPTGFRLTADEEIELRKQKAGRQKLVKQMQAAFDTLRSVDQSLADPSLQHLILPSPADFHASATQYYMGLAMLNLQQSALILQAYEDQH